MSATKMLLCRAACIVLICSLSACSDDESTVVFPAAQLKFHALNADCANRYDAGQNEIQQSAAFNECNRQRKQFAEVNKVSDWVGRLERIQTNQGGSEVVVTISSDAGGFDISYDTPGVGVAGLDMFTAYVIHRSSPIYQKLAGMKEGALVRFDATFLPSSKRGIDEESLTEVGSMDSPAFTIRLDDIRPYDAGSGASSAAHASPAVPQAASSPTTGNSTSAALPASTPEQASAATTTTDSSAQPNAAASASAENTDDGSADSGQTRLYSAVRSDLLENGYVVAPGSDFTGNVLGDKAQCSVGLPRCNVQWANVTTQTTVCLKVQVDEGDEKKDSVYEVGNGPC